MRITAFIAIPMLALLTLLSWSFSSAAGSSPDDDFHLASIWCGLGDRDGLCENPGGETVERLVPAPVAQANCAAFQADVSGSCWNEGAHGLSQVKRANIDRLYPPLFYATMSLFATEDIAASIVTMRAVNSLIAVALITAVFVFLPRRLRPALILSVVASSVPLGLFVFASTNPSSWALMSAATVWVSLYGALITDSRKRAIILTALAVLAAVMGAGARADSALYAVFGAFIALWLGLRRRRTSIIPVIGGLLILVTSVALYFSATQSNAATTGLSHNGPLSTGGLLSNAFEVPNLWVGVFGYWPLGWFDTGLPAVVWVLGGTVFGYVLLAGLKDAPIRRVIAVAAAIAAMWFVPFYILAQSGLPVGQGVQPRYILPLMIIAVGAAAAHENPRMQWRGWPLILAAAALTVTNSVSLRSNIRRYTTGVDVQALDPGVGAEWWWGWAPSPMAVWLIGSATFALFLAALIVINHVFNTAPTTNSRSDVLAEDSVAPAYEASNTPSQDSRLASPGAAAR